MGYLSKKFVKLSILAKGEFNAGISNPMLANMTAKRESQIKNHLMHLHHMKTLSLK
jgi:hypothetical protein